jgi:hypothetical protein
VYTVKDRCKARNVSRGELRIRVREERLAGVLPITIGEGQGRLIIYCYLFFSVWKVLTDRCILSLTFSVC